MQEKNKLKSEQTREGIGAVTVTLLRCHAFADASNASVVLCFPGRVGQMVKGRRQVKAAGEGEG